MRMGVSFPFPAARVPPSSTSQGVVLLSGAHHHDRGPFANDSGPRWQLSSNRLRKRHGAFTAARDRRDADRRRQLGAAVDGGHGEIELWTARFAGQGDPNGMEQ